MIATIIIVTTALAWLMYETNFLRVNLCEETIAEYDRRILAELDRQGTIKEAQYQAWCAKRYEVKERHASLSRFMVDQQADYPQYNWMQVEEDLNKRRCGEMIYQRGRGCPTTSLLLDMALRATSAYSPAGTGYKSTNTTATSGNLHSICQTAM